jgi:hypothetical protein
MVDEEGAPAAVRWAAASVAAVFVEAPTEGRPSTRPRGTSCRRISSLTFELVHDIHPCVWT